MAKLNCFLYFGKGKKIQGKGPLYLLSHYFETISHSHNSKTQFSSLVPFTKTQIPLTLNQSSARFQEEKKEGKKKKKKRLHIQTC